MPDGSDEDPDGLALSARRDIGQAHDQAPNASTVRPKPTIPADGGPTGGMIDLDSSDVE